MSEMKTSEVLDLAADAIQHRGWTTGSWNNTKEGAPVCLEGGIAAALGWEIDLDGVDDAGYETFTSCPAYVAVQEYLSLGPFALYHWNDRAERTKEEVIEVLRAAAAVERAKEESLEHQGVAA